jgi:hypothetical protein
VVKSFALNTRKAPAKGVFFDEKGPWKGLKKPVDGIEK